MNINSTDPNTLLGFGSWSRFGEGKMLISQSSSDSDFDTGEETGGAKTHTIAQTNLPDVSLTSGSAVFKRDELGQGGANDRGDPTGSGSNYEAVSVSLGGDGTAVNHMNPYIAVYMWKRTA